MIDDTFLAINKKYLNIGLKSIEILIIAQINEFERNNCQCYITNRQFADIFGESESTIKRAIDKLESFHVLRRQTHFIDGNGKANKQRVLFLNNQEEWKVQNDPTKMESSDISDGRFKNDKWKGHNDPIKEKEKENKKDNIIETEKILNLISFDKEIQEDIKYGLGSPEDYILEDFYSFVSEELNRLGENITFVVFYDKIQSYKDGKCMGTCRTAS